MLPIDKLFKAVFLLTGLTLVSSANAIVVLEDYNDTNNLLNRYNSDASPQFTAVANGGIGGSGAINVPLGSQDVWTTKTGYSVNGVGDVYTISAYFKIKANSGYGGLGLAVNDSNEPLARGSIAQGLGVTFHGGGGAFENNGTPTNLTWAGGDLILGNWYKFIYTVTATAVNTYTVQIEIYNSDAAGNVGALKTSHTDTAVNADVGGDANLHVFFSSSGSRMEKIDNFTIDLEGSVIVPPNDAPKFTSTPNAMGVVSTTYSHTITTSDTDVGQPVSINPEKLPAWLTLTDNGDRTALLSGTPSASDVGADNEVILRANDTEFDVYQDFTISIINDPCASSNFNNGCTVDTDADGIPDSVEGETLDSDADGTPDYLESATDDDDNDGVANQDDAANADACLPSNLSSACDSDGDGISNGVEGETVDSDGDGIPDYLESAIDDDDNDGVPNQDDATNMDACLPSDLSAACDSDDDGISDGDERTNGTNPNASDSDGDGIPDDEETGDFDNDGVIDALDTDSDNDGISDDVEAGGTGDAFVDSDGDGIPNLHDSDSDNDGISDSDEGTVDSDDDGVLDFLDRDSDNDGLPDAVEQAAVSVASVKYVADAVVVQKAVVANIDTDRDGLADYVDIDSDNDGIPDNVEANIILSNDVDMDGINDQFDVDVTGGQDSNGDNIDDSYQIVDFDGDGTPDFRDLDSDNDSIFDIIEAGGRDDNGDAQIDDPQQDQGSLLVPLDTDGDGLGDWRELDSDNDGVFDIAYAQVVDIDNDGKVDGSGDADGDGIADSVDRSPGFGSVGDSDADGILDEIEGNDDFDNDGLPNSHDGDSDNDGLSDSLEAGDVNNPVDTDNDGLADFVDTDSDNDGISDALEGMADTNQNGVPDYIDAEGEIKTSGGGGGSMGVLSILLLAALALYKRSIGARLFFSQSKALAGLTVAFALLGQTVIADKSYAESSSDKHWHLGGAMGVSWLSPDGNALGFERGDDKRDFAYKLSLSRNLFTNTAIGIQFSDMGQAQLLNRNDAVQTAYPNAAISYKAYAAYARYDWSKGDLRPFAKLGVSILKSRAGGAPITVNHDKSVRMLIGAGVSQQLSESNWSVSAEADWYDANAFAVFFGLKYAL